MHRQIKYLISINAFFIFAFNMFLPLYAIFVESISASIYHVGGVWSFYIFTTGLLVYIISRYENRIKYADNFLILGFLMRALGWSGYIFVSSVLHLYVVQILLALGEAFGTPSYNALFSRYLDRGRFASEWGLNISINSFLMGGAAIAGTLIAATFGFSVLFIFMILLSLISTILSLRFKKELSRL